MLRAIYSDIALSERYGVYRYNDETNSFHMINRTDIRCGFEEVLNEKDFILFAVGGDVWQQIRAVQNNL